jgi:hypothetical protein
VNKITSGIGVAVGGFLIDYVHLPRHAMPERSIRNYSSARHSEHSDPGDPGGHRHPAPGLYRIDRKVHEDNLRRIIDAAALEEGLGAVADSPKLG